MLRSIEAWLPLVRAAVGPRTQIFLVVPFGGFGGFKKPPRGVLARAVGQYVHASTDTSVHLIELGHEAAAGLTGFVFREGGGYQGSAESADGLHPRSKRQGELGRMVATAVAPLLPTSTTMAMGHRSRLSLEQLLRDAAAAVPDECGMMMI